MEHEQMLRLLGAVSQGDRKSFEQLYNATSGQLYAVCLKILVRKELAEEAMQEAYVRIWHNAGDYQVGKGTVLTWMVSIARYRALDLIRYHKIRKEELLDKSDLYNGFDNETDNLALKSEQKLNLERCLKDLDAQQKQAIHLAYFNGFSHHEVTHYLEKPLGTIKSWIRRGLLSLQRCLAL